MFFVLKKKCLNKNKKQKTKPQTNQIEINSINYSMVHRMVFDCRTLAMKREHRSETCVVDFECEHNSCTNDVLSLIFHRRDMSYFEFRSGNV